MTEVVPTELSRHTPGPWHWDSDPVKNDPFDRRRYRVCATGKTITQIYYSSYEGGPTNAEADARLIAAAPDMLQVLKFVRELWAQDDICAEVAAIDEAIATAEGRS